MDGKSLSLLAAKAGCIHICKYIISKGVQAGQLDMQTKNLMLRTAVSERDSTLETIRFLVEEMKLDVNQQTDGMGGELVGIAALYGRLGIVRYSLEEVHADMNLPANFIYDSTLCATVSSKDLDTVRYLVGKAKVDVNLQGFYHRENALGLAADIGNLVIVRYLVEEAEADVNSDVSFDGPVGLDRQNSLQGFPDDYRQVLEYLRRVMDDRANGQCQS